MSLKDLRTKRSGEKRINIDGLTQIKTEALLGKEVTVRNVDVIKTNNGECGIMIFDEFPNSFYFAGSVLTTLCTDIIADDSLEELKNDGLKITIFKQKSEKTNREYVTYRFI